MRYRAIILLSALMAAVLAAAALPSPTLALPSPRPVLPSPTPVLPQRTHAQPAAAMEGETTTAPDSGVKRALAHAARGSAPVMDGRLEDAVWARAEPATGFVQTRPDPGEAASRRTEARVVYDANAVYVGMRMYDDPDSVVTQLARRDASGIHSDWAHILIDSYFDRRTAFRFSASPSGTKKDVLHYDDSNEDLNWDAVWEVATHTDSLGWTAEFRIPLSQLRFSTPGAVATAAAAEGDGRPATADDGDDGRAGGAGEPQMVWGINFGREIARHGEWSWWSPVLPESGGFVSEAGELYGLAGLESPKRLELLPYGVGRLTRAPAQPDNPFYEANDPFGAFGADLKYGVTSNLTLSATINPDFGQVEADPSVVNLSAYETFYPEKRPFFTEGSNVFQFGIGFDDGSGESLFYTRRIGRSPQRSLAGAGWVDRPEATTILGAAKLSGKTPDGWSVGFLNALTAEEHARVEGPEGDGYDAPVEPLTNYLVGSVARDFREGRSSVGLLVTATNRRLDAGATGGATAGAHDAGAFEFLPAAAYAAGLRARHRFADGTWEASAYGAGSHVRGEPEAIDRLQRSPARYYQRPDATHTDYDPTRTSLTGAAANFGLWKIGGGPLRGGVGGHVRTPGFEVNDLGYQRESDMALLFANLRWNQFQPVGIFRELHVGLNPSLGWTTGGEHTWAQVGSFGNFQFRNLWNGGWWIARRFEGLNPGALRGGPAIVRPSGYNMSMWLNTDRRERLVGNVNAWGGREDDSGRWNYGVGLGATLRPSSRLNLSLRPTVNRNHDTWQYVTQPADEAGETHYVFGELDQTTLSLTTRLNLTLSPTLSFELYAQPFVSGGEYSNFKEVADPKAAAFADRFAEYGSALRYEEGGYRADSDGDGVADVAFHDPDFNFKQMRGNAVLRWEYTPGSTLYLVWNQSRTAYLPGPDGAVFDLGRDMNRLFNREAGFPTPVTNTFMVKVDYWLSL